MILIEDSLIRYLFGGCETGGGGTEIPSLIERLIGYAWVGAFLVWSAPVYLYPTMHRIHNMDLNWVFQLVLLGWSLLSLVE